MTVLTGRRVRLRAFTLIELAVVLVIIFILAGVALATFTVITNRANNQDAMTLLQRATVVEQQQSNSWGVYSPYGKDLTATGQEVTYAENGSPSLKETQVSVAVGSKGNLGLAVQSRTGTCFYVRVAPLITGGAVTDVTAPDSAPCSGTEALDDGEVLTPYTLGGTIHVLAQ
jgi:type II secretory pathway pseudopilin PulG